jgi:cytoskeletal protein CcmA (bactofilin family)
MKRTDILRKLEERLARGEISEKTYLEIKARYESEPEEPEQSDETGNLADAMADLGTTVGAAVAQATAAASQAASEATRAVSDAMRGIDISGIGTKLTDETIKIVGRGVVSGNPVRTTTFEAAGSARVQGPLEAEVARVDGACIFEGDVHVGNFRCSGSARIVGNLRTEDMESSGALHVEGNVEAEDISVSGALQVKGDVTAEDISVSGGVHVKGNVTAEDFHSGGSVRIEGALKAEDFHSGGSITIDGGLKAEDVMIDLGGSSRITTIEAENIRVKATGGFFRVRGELTSDRIEATEDVELEATTAAFVKGQEVTIGPHCKIDVVEARDLTVHQSSEVRERRSPS